MHCMAYWHPPRASSDNDNADESESGDDAIDMVSDQDDDDGPPTKKKSKASAPDSDDDDDDSNGSDSDSDSEDECPPAFTTKFIAFRHTFDDAAFAPLQHSVGASAASSGSGSGSGGGMPAPTLHSTLPALLKATLPGIVKMRGERGNKTVTRMIQDIYSTGLHMHHPPTSPINSQVIPALRHVVADLAKRKPKDPKRLSTVETLAEACQNCQQVQAREILRLYSDMTAQTATFERQLLYSLVRQKEAALDRLISYYHSPECDQDHTKVKPWQQRPHLYSVRQRTMREAENIVVNYFVDPKFRRQFRFYSLCVWFAHLLTGRRVT